MTTTPNSTSSSDYSAIVKVTPLAQKISTELLFNRGYKLSKLSPIDEFIDNCNKLNLLWVAREESAIVSEFSTIVFLGYFSALEGYIRALVRTLIYNDVYSSSFAENKQITFGAALHHSKKLLPEALMDTYSFISSENIITTFKNLTDISLAIDDLTIAELDKICELRHCCVHRFGKLGAKNAIALGLTAHSDLFEKPLALKKSDLELLSGTLRSIVKTINNAVYKAILDRTYPVIHPSNKNKNQARSLWSSDYETDKILFSVYYKIFSSRKEVSPLVREMYNRFMTEKAEALNVLIVGKKAKPSATVVEAATNNPPTSGTEVGDPPPQPTQPPQPPPDSDVETPKAL